jgi:hypothetical protein
VVASYQVREGAARSLHRPRHGGVCWDADTDARSGGAAPRRAMPGTQAGRRIPVTLRGEATSARLYLHAGLVDIWRVGPKRSEQLDVSERPETFTDHNEWQYWAKTVGIIRAYEVAIGSDETGVIIVIAKAPVKPSEADVRAMWQECPRSGDRPVLLAVFYPSGTEGEKFCFMGPTQSPFLGFDAPAKRFDQLYDDISEALNVHDLWVEVQSFFDSLPASEAPVGTVGR